ncbi:hypothetical protein K0M31_009444 [Melipona bicolor]|uniref:Uncharacterized protein n=1 Tax=Melipona bicolor TaxID=60889 RepID=A0AA40FN82_9HYME|nr:hypothetical protein K0M31_009444 [Melipona bicolor]
MRRPLVLGVRLKKGLIRRRTVDERVTFRVASNAPLQTQACPFRKPSADPLETAKFSFTSAEIDRGIVLVFCRKWLNARGTTRDSQRGSSRREGEAAPDDDGGV